MAVLFLKRPSHELGIAPPPGKDSRDRLRAVIGSPTDTSSAAEAAKHQRCVSLTVKHLETTRASVAQRR